MLFLLFQIGNDRYAIDTRSVVEVLPLMQLKGLPQAPTGIAGVLNYRGVPLAAVDLCELAAGRPAQARFSTRILVVSCANGERLGLIVERANETLKREPGDFLDAAVKVDGAPYLGPVTKDARGFIQWIDPEKLLTPEVRRAVFERMAEAA